MKYKTESQILQEAFNNLPDTPSSDEPQTVTLCINEGVPNEAPYLVDITFCAIDGIRWKFISATHNGAKFSLKSYIDSIEKVKLIYSPQGAFNDAVLISPAKQMEALGFDVIGSESVYFHDYWIFYVRPFDFNLPDYITKIE